MKELDRRTFLKAVGLGGTMLYLRPLAYAAEPIKTGVALGQISPIDRLLADVAPRQFFGDDFERPHKVLWNKDGMTAALAGQVPRPAEHTDLVIIGGGISGLTSAYLLKGYKPIVLELAPRFGGNSKGQSWRGMDYSIGAAYVVEPEAETDIGKLFVELGLADRMKLKEGEDPVSIDGKIYHKFWTGETVPQDSPAREQFSKLSAYFKKVLDSEESPYPDIPVTDESQRASINELDKLTFKEHVLKIAEVSALHPHIETAIEHYCWSSFGASASEISAAAGLNFYAAEFGNLNVFPGGNAAIAERLLEKLAAALPATNLRTNSLVYDVKVSGSGVQIRYFDRKGAIQTIVAKAVIMAAPKFVVAKILQDIEPERLEAIRKLKYRSFLVANVLMKGAPPESFYDLYMLGDGKLESGGTAVESARKGVTDVILGNFAHPTQDSTVLTLYRSLPYDGGRAELYPASSYDTFRTKFEEQIKGTILPTLKLSAANIHDLRIARWGHPLPTAAPGLIADGVVDRLRKPFKERVFFVEQDNWALPAFETGVTEAFSAVPQLKKVLG